MLISCHVAGFALMLSANLTMDELDYDKNNSFIDIRSVVEAEQVQSGLAFFFSCEYSATHIRMERRGIRSVGKTCYCLCTYLGVVQAFGADPTARCGVLYFSEDDCSHAWQACAFLCPFACHCVLGLVLRKVTHI